MKYEIRFREYIILGGNINYFVYIIKNMNVNVIMSVYNEPFDFIEKAIESVLCQTYKDFSFIIVNDNPKRKDLDLYLENWKLKDKRIYVLKNVDNIGLALSMNKAVSYLESDYLIRMDADDICYPKRFEKIIDIITKFDYDLVCSSFDYIDEQGHLLGKNTKIYTDDQLKAFLKYDNVIHHPTTIFKTSVFNHVGQYNDFPCAQDYDLWNRFVNYGARIHMIEEPLLKYRIQRNSTTYNKRFTQSIVMDYIKKLNDTNTPFSKNDFNTFYEDNKKKFEKSFKEYNEKYEIFLKTKKGIIGFLESLIFSSYLRKKFISLIKFHVFKMNQNK